MHDPIVCILCRCSSACRGSGWYCIWRPSAPEHDDRRRSAESRARHTGRGKPQAAHGGAILSIQGRNAFPLNFHLQSEGSSCSNTHSTCVLQDVPPEKRLTLSFPHISAWVPDLFGPGAPQGGNLFTRAYEKLRGGKSEQQKAKGRQVIEGQR